MSVTVIAVLAGLSAALAIVVLPVAAYLGSLAILAGRPKPPAYATPRTRFRVVVPAHNEEQNIAATVASLRAVDYPDDLFAVVVVADNCNDATAARAREAGALVMERQHDTLRGKGYALEHAFGRIVEEGLADAVVVVDADTLVSKNLLRAFAHRIESGAHAIQAEYGVSNVDANWRTRLMAVALAMFHGVRSIAREKQRVSVGLRGNGMCFSVDVLKRVPHAAYGLVEDVEYTIALGLAGERVWSAHEAHVLGEMVTTGKAAASQRQRWEGGRLQLARQKLPVLLPRALKERSALLFDLAVDLTVPPLSIIGLCIGAGLLLEASLFVVDKQLHLGALPWLAAALMIGLYVMRGVHLSGLGLKGLLALAWAPFYVLWKLTLIRPWKKKSDAWIRTTRESELPKE